MEGNYGFSGIGPESSGRVTDGHLTAEGGTTLPAVNR